MQRTDGQATGKALIEWPLVRIALDTSLPAHIYLPFFRGQPLEKVINREAMANPGCLDWYVAFARQRADAART